MHGLCQEFEHSQSWNYFRKENLQVLNLLSYLLSTWEFKNTYLKKCRSHLVAPLAFYECMHFSCGLDITLCLKNSTIHFCAHNTEEVM